MSDNLSSSSSSSSTTIDHHECERNRDSEDGSRSNQPDSDEDDDRVLMEGWIVKEGELRKSWKRRYMTLTRNKIRYYARKEGRFRKGRSRLKGTIKTSDIISLSKIDVYKRHENCLALNSGRRTYFITTSTAAEPA